MEKRRRRLEMDGLKIVSPLEMQSFICKVRSGLAGDKRYKQHLQFCIYVPQDIVRILELKPNEPLLIAIKRPSNEEIKEYG